MAQDKDVYAGGLFDSFVLPEPAATSPQERGQEAFAGGLFEGLEVTPEQTPAQPPSTPAYAGGLFDDTAPINSGQIEQDYQDLLILGDNPEADIEPGFFSSLQTGILGLYDSAVRTPAKLLAESFIEIGGEDSFLGQLGLEERIRQAEEDKWLGRFQKKRPVSKTLEAIAADETTLGEAWDLFTESDEKWTVVKEIAGSSFPATLGIAGGFKVAGLAGAFSSSAIISFGDDYQESLRQGKSKDEALVSAFLKAPIQGAFDMASFAFPMKVKLANKYKDALVQTLVQTTLGMGAEAGKHAAVGEEFSGGRVFLEGLGEGLLGPIDIMTARKGKAEKAYDKLITELKDLAEKSETVKMQEEVADVIRQLEGRESIEAEEEVDLEQVVGEAGLTGFSLPAAPTETVITNLVLDTDPMSGAKNLNESKTKENLPPEIPGYKRLYRASSPSITFEDVFDVEKLKAYDPGKLPGQFYTTELSYADYFRETYGSDATISFVDVPTANLKGKEIAPGEYVIDLKASKLPAGQFGQAVRPLTAAELQGVNTSTVTSISEEVAMTVKATVVDSNGQEVPLSQIDWGKESVVATTDTYLQQLLLDTNLEILEVDKQILEALRSNPEAVPTLEANKELLLADEQMFSKQRALEAELLGKMSGIVNTWVKTYAPAMKIILSSGQISNILSQQALERIDTQFANGKLTEEEYRKNINIATKFDIKSEEAHDIMGHHFKLYSGTSVIEVDLTSTNTFEGTPNSTLALESLAHEFGHALISNVYDNLDLNTKKALVNGYRKWLKKLKKAKTKEEFYRVHGGAIHAKILGSKSKVNVNVKKARYIYGMNEYLANQMAKALGTDKLVGTPVEGFFKKALRALRTFFTSNRNIIPESSFTNFLNTLAAKTTLSELKKAQAEADVATEEAVLERARDTVESIVGSSKLVPPKGGKRPGGRSYGKEEFRGDLDKYNLTLKWGTTLIQMGKLNPHIVGLQKYVDLIKQWWNSKMQQTAKADERLEQWNRLKKRNAQNLGAFMQELTVKSYEDGKRYSHGDKVWDKLVDKYKMNDEMLGLADLIERDFAEVLNDLEAVQIETANRTLTDEIVKEEEIVSITETFRALRERNFFPLSRFGDRFMRVRAAKNMVYDGVEYKVGETLTFETFENDKSMLKRQKIFSNKKKYIVEGGLLNDTQKQFAGFPPQFLAMLKDRLDLNEVQKGEFEDLIRDLAPGKSFTKHMMQRKNTPGYSTDAIRSYANYFLHFGNYVSRIKYKGVLLDAIAEVGDSADIIGKRTGNSIKRTRIQQYMQEHYEVAMNPGNELANLRALGFLWYLGFVPKSAVVNLTQVPLVTYPHLAAKYGDAQAMKALGKATKDAALYWKNPKGLKEGQRTMIAELINSGILDESMATELAAASEGSLLNRLAPGTILGSEKAARSIRRMAGAGAWMFQKAEKMNRRVTALAAYDLARRAGVAHEGAVEAARDAVESTQYEYARWNRPKFSQGKKSVFFLFWQYMQNSLFFLATDPGRMRYLMMMFLFAGLSGLPFAEDAMDLFDYISKKMNKKFGEDFAPINIRLAAREFIQELGMNPDLVMHGSSRYSFGMSALGDAVGLPIPNVDMSGSLSMGNIIPGFGDLLGDRPFNQGLGRAAESAGGAVLAMPVQLMRAIADDNPDTLKRFERAMPSFARHMSKAYRYASRGEETLPDGTVITRFNLDDSMQKAEIAMQFLGFNSTRVAEAKVPVYMTKEIIQYYMLRKQSLMELLDYSKRNGDSKMYRETWGAVKKYNGELRRLGLGALGIRPSVVRKNLKDRIKNRRMQEKGFVGGKAGYPVSREVYDTFESVEEVP